MGKARKPTKKSQAEVLGERLREARSKLGVSQEEMANRIGIGQGALADYESGRREPSRPVLLMLEREFKVNRRWLLEAEGEPFLRDLPVRPAIVTDPRELERLEELEGKDRYYAVPYLRDPAAAGSGLVMEDQVAGYCIIHERVAPRPGEIRCVRVSGESMAPGLTHGSIVAINTTMKDHHAVEDRIVCARTAEGEVVIKRLRMRPPHVLLLSDNPDQKKYPPLVVDLRQEPEPVIGQVVWAWVDLR